MVEGVCVQRAGHVHRDRGGERLGLSGATYLVMRVDTTPRAMSILKQREAAPPFPIDRTDAQSAAASCGIEIVLYCTVLYFIVLLCGVEWCGAACCRHRLVGTEV